MSGPQFQPLPDDPDAFLVSEMFDARSEGWILTAPGDYHTAGAQAMRSDGTDLQNVVVLQWPGRINHSDELVTVRLMMSPEDAVGLSETLGHSGKWMIEQGLR